MFVYAMLCLTLLPAAPALRLIWRGFRSDAPACRAQLALALALSVFIFLYGAWIYLSAYTKYGFTLAVLLTAVTGFMRHRKQPASCLHRKARPYVTLAVMLAALDVLYFTGTAGRTRYARLRFPLKAGRYFVLQGGKGLPANAFHYNSRRAVCAMDIVKLDAAGRRCSRIFSKELSDYFIFGDTVFAPCDGTVQRSVSDNPDNIPPHRERGPHNLNGVVIDGADYTVFLGHMQQGKVFVAAGDAVRAGQPIGLAGNSGMSIEPHLHLQAHMKSRNGGPWYEQPQLFMLFGGKEYLLFEEINAGIPGLR